MLPRVLSRQLSLTAILTTFAAAVVARGGQDGTRIGQRFRRFDRNGDGKLTRDEAPRLFDRLDADKDGVVTLEEARAVSRRRTEDRTPPPSATVPAGVRRRLDIPYTRIDGPGSDLQRLDVYAPEQGRDHPVMIYVHGGGWQRGDKRVTGRKVPFFTERGYVFVSVNYRLFPDVNVLSQARDVADAVAWVHDHIAEYRGDPGQLFLMGHSAGAHLVALVATNERFLKNAGKPLGILRGVISLDTQAYDVLERVARGTRLYRNVFAGEEEEQKACSPIHHVAPGKGIPPFLICYSRGMGRRPNPNRAVIARRFAETLRKAGIPSRVIDASDRSHSDINRGFGDPDDNVTQAALAFLEALRANSAKPATP
ncbi:MAG: alpha/beta hydrolase fold domain-containing protein [Kiritimatiellaeota bacterium]|nr:alpha/beta hydrolase fold domain-containing protein [Kiritimatiellota bacterium]